MNLNDLARKIIPERLDKGTRSTSHRIDEWHPNAGFPQPPHQILPDGEVIAKPRGVSKVCLRCNGDKVIPMRMPGLTLYECITCGHKWRDSYNKPGQVLRPKEWRALRPHLENRHGRLLI